MRANDIMAVLEDVLPGVSGLAAVYLMGSAVGGHLRPDSDIDIALLPSAGRSFSLQERLGIAAMLELHLARTVDVGIVGSRNLIYAAEAILKGKRVGAYDVAYTEAEETRLLGAYYLFLEDRREVEDAYRVA